MPRGAICLAYIHFQMDLQMWCQSVQPFDSFPTLLNLWHPTPPPPKCPLGIEGRLGFSLCPFPYESADVNQSWCQSVQPFDGFPRLFNLWHPTPPPPPPPRNEMPPEVLRGDLYLAYVLSQMNPQTWIKVGANRTGFPDFWIVDPLKPPKCPLCLQGQFVWRISIPVWICTCLPNLVSIGPAVW